jgi:putative phage-type endonuclease
VSLALRQGTPAWREARKALVTATDIPVLLGLSPYKCEADLADEKRGIAPETETNLRMRVGKALEDLIADEYERVTGYRTRRWAGLAVSKDIEWAAASPDRKRKGALVELKWTGSKSRFADGLPQDVEAQVAWQLGVTGYSHADVAILVNGDDVLVREVDADPALFANLVTVAADFRRRLAEGGPFSRDLNRIKRDYPADNGAEMLADGELDARSGRSSTRAPTGSAWSRSRPTSNARSRSGWPSSRCCGVTAGTPPGSAPSHARRRTGAWSPPGSSDNCPSQRHRPSSGSIPASGRASARSGWSWTRRIPRERQRPRTRRWGRTRREGRRQGRPRRAHCRGADAVLLRGLRIARAQPPHPPVRIHHPQQQAHPVRHPRRGRPAPGGPKGITITSLDPRQVGDLFVVVATGRDRSGREDSSTGAVSTAGLRGEALANAMMKAETKAKRRLTLSLAGLGMTDETEVDSIPGAVIPEPPAVLSLAEKAAAKAAEAKVDDAIGMPREAFLAALERADITPQEAAERGASLFPGVDPKSYSDAQRADLLLALTDAPSEAMFAEGELEAVMAKIP